MDHLAASYLILFCATAVSVPFISKKDAIMVPPSPTPVHIPFLWLSNWTYGHDSAIQALGHVIAGSEDEQLGLLYQRVWRCAVRSCLSEDPLRPGLI